MSESSYDVLIIGSGAGGAGAAFNLVNAGKRVLLLEKGERLPRDGSTLDVRQVFKEGRFKNKRPWVDGRNRQLMPEEYYNVGGKTKWYGAALLRFSPHQFQADAPHQWQPEPLPLGLKKEILADPSEARHFDGFASCAGYKSDAERNLLDALAGKPDFTLLTGKEVTGFTYREGAPTAITGAVCSDGARHAAEKVVLAAGALTSPRILQDHLERTGLLATLPSAPLVGANFKCHINSALLATQLPAAVPKFVANAAGSRAYGFFVTTEDGSSPDNRVISCGGHGGLPVLDYEFGRIQPAYEEHHAVIRAFEASLARARMIGAARYVGLAGTAHALGTLVTGTDPRQSVVDPAGKVHGFENLYVSDGSALPRASRVNPALTIYAWGLRLGAHLARPPRRRLPDGD